MNESAPEWGAGSDEPTGRVLWQVRPAGHLDTGEVRTGSSYADDIQSNATASTAVSVSDRPVPTTHDCNNQHTKPDAHRSETTVERGSPPAGNGEAAGPAGRTDGSRFVVGGWWCR
jgi:hypothetical protein